MVKIISLKCPECGADISIEEGHKQCFCQYCGAKIMIDDGSTTHTYRKVDEARIKEAEVDKLIRLKELEIKQKEAERKGKIKILKIKAVLLLVFTGAIVIIFGQLRDYVMLEMCGLFPIIVALFIVMSLSDSEDK
mgnify:CR=1 FL=1